MNDDNLPKCLLDIRQNNSKGKVKKFIKKKLYGGRLKEEIKPKKKCII